MEMSDYNPSDSFCIEFTIPANDRVDVQEVRRAIEYLGGTPAGSEFAFSSAQRRDEAIAILCDKFGTSYFARVEAEVNHEQAKGKSK